MKHLWQPVCLWLEWLRHSFWVAERPALGVFVRWQHCHGGFSRRCAHYFLDWRTSIWYVASSVGQIEIASPWVMHIHLYLDCSQRVICCHQLSRVYFQSWSLVGVVIELWFLLHRFWYRRVSWWSVLDRVLNLASPGPCCSCLTCSRCSGLGSMTLAEVVPAMVEITLATSFLSKSSLVNYVSFCEQRRLALPFDDMSAFLCYGTLLGRSDW